MPAGWKAQFDKANKRYFFINEVSFRLPKVLNVR
jgi:hypothetical protein